LAVGSSHWPGCTPGEVLVNLAEERANQIASQSRPGDPLDGLITLSTGGRRVTRQMVEAALDED
jgi:hypothetical protein